MSRGAPRAVPYARTMSTEGGKASARTCARPGCDRPVIEQGGQGSEKRFCSSSCRTKNYQQLEAEALRNPNQQIGRAAEKALRHLETLGVEDALPFVNSDVRHNFKQVREVLHEIRRRTTGHSSSDDPPS